MSDLKYLLIDFFDIIRASDNLIGFGQDIITCVNEIPITKFVANMRRRRYKKGMSFQQKEILRIRKIIDNYDIISIVRKITHAGSYHLINVICRDIFTSSMRRHITRLYLQKEKEISDAKFELSSIALRRSDLRVAPLILHLFRLNVCISDYRRFVYQRSNEDLWELYERLKKYKPKQLAILANSELYHPAPNEPPRELYKYWSALYYLSDYYNNPVFGM